MIIIKNKYNLLFLPLMLLTVNQGHAGLFKFAVQDLQHRISWKTCAVLIAGIIALVGYKNYNNKQLSYTHIAKKIKSIRHNKAENNPLFERLPDKNHAAEGTINVMRSSIRAPTAHIMHPKLNREMCLMPGDGNEWRSRTIYDTKAIPYYEKWKSTQNAYRIYNTDTSKDIFTYAGYSLVKDDQKLTTYDFDPNLLTTLAESNIRKNEQVCEGRALDNGQFEIQALGEKLILTYDTAKHLWHSPSFTVSDDTVATKYWISTLDDLPKKIFVFADIVFQHIALVTSIYNNHL